jgi:hypothetical protein
VPHPSNMSASRRSSRAASLELQVQYRPTSSLHPDPANARKHSQRQLIRLKAIVAEFGFTNPILVDEYCKVIAGHLRLEVAKAIGMETVPCLQLDHLTPAQKTALALADNKIGDMSEFNPQLLAAQFKQLLNVDYNIEFTAFETAEVDIIMETPGFSVADPSDTVAEPDRGSPPVSQPGDLWELGCHKLLVGDSLEAESYLRLLDGALAEMAFVDGPYNVPIAGHVSGLGKAQHAEFAMASGEMSPDEFTAFLTTYMQLLAKFSTDGSIHYHCIDWGHLREMLAAGAAVYTEHKALCVWEKTNGGMGSLYRSKHELVLVYKNGKAPHVNNVNLGRDGRYRTNVWHYPGANTFRKGRNEDLAAHPTVKPVSLVADAMRDCSKRGALIIDPFLGSGTTILAAERTGRRAAGIEIDAGYADVAIRRWQAMTGAKATLSGDGITFDEIEAERSGEEATGE